MAKQPPSDHGLWDAVDASPVHTAIGEWAGKRVAVRDESSLEIGDRFRVMLLGEYGLKLPKDERVTEDSRYIVVMLRRYGIEYPPVAGWQPVME